MRHAQDDLFDAQIAAPFDDLFHGGDDRLTAVQTEALGAGELHMKKLLKAFGFDQLVENGFPAFRREGDFLVSALNARLDP